MRGPVLAVTAGIMLAAGVAVATAAQASTASAVCGAGDVTTAVDEGDMYSKGGRYFEDLDIAFTNMSGAACVLEGMPAVELTGPATASFQRSYHVPQSGTATLLTLTSGASAHTTLRVHQLPEEENAWEPQRMRITLPASAETVTVAWPQGLTIQQETQALPGLGLPNVVAGA
jgi:hypothetical protein